MKAEPATPQLAAAMSYRGLQYRVPARYRVIWFASLGLLLACLLFEPHTLNAASMRIITPLMAILLVASLGQLLVVIVGGFDLSVAAVMTLSSAILLKVTGAGNDLFLAIVLCLAAGLAVGLINGTLTSLGLNPLIATLAMSGVVASVTLLISGGGVDLASLESPASLTDFALGRVGEISSLLFVAIGLALLAALVIRRSGAGRRLFAVGTNPVAAETIGIRVRRYNIAAYAIGGVLYALAGLALAGFVQRPDIGVGAPYQLSTFIVVALGGAIIGGGAASVASTVAGAAFLTLLTQLLTSAGLTSGEQSLIQGVVLIAAVAVVNAIRGGSKGTVVTSALRKLGRPRNEDQRAQSASERS